jgi:hypothetical protein
MYVTTNHNASCNLLPCLQNLARTENGPAPVSEVERQNTEAWLKRAGGKPVYDAGEPKVGIWESAFTRRREIFIGRLAMVRCLQWFA